jgi:drug/metabolite transporter (DMT)-like permease
MNIALVYILVGVVGSGIGQVLLKKGMASMGPLTLTPELLGGVLWRIATNPFVIGGLCVYGLSTLFWLTALSRVPLSYAYPFISLNLLVIMLVSWGLFGEQLSWLRIVGTLIIGIGVILLARS